MASHLLFMDAKTMLRTALVIVLVTAGNPLSSLACELWCNSPSGETHHRAAGCHDASLSGPEGQQIAPYVAGCPDAAATAPFVVGVRHAESAPVAPAATALVDASPIGSDHDETAARLGVFDVQPPRPPSFHLVLRV